ncbi:MAG: HIT domain-containing protein [Candidatus Omnitrophica bacterium]|nr:HIT domain-containing protein [Candidatus Omnitrophota bacterium]
MRKLWAPWRMEYIQKPKKKSCFLCRVIKEKKDKNNFVILRTKKTISLLNIYPYNNGHVMIAPKKHIKSPDKLSPEEINEIFSQVKKILAALKKSLGPSGFNLGLNLDKTAGAGLEGHLHIHIVPRWQGDTNFMPILGNTKIISQSLSQTHKAIKRYL